MALGHLVRDLSRRHLQGSVEIDHAVSLVVVRVPGGSSGPESFGDEIGAPSGLARRSCRWPRYRPALTSNPPHPPHDCHWAYLTIGITDRAFRGFNRQSFGQRQLDRQCAIEAGGTCVTGGVGWLVTRRGDSHGEARLPPAPRRRPFSRGLKAHLSLRGM